MWMNIYNLPNPSLGILLKYGASFIASYFSGSITISFNSLIDNLLCDVSCIGSILLYTLVSIDCAAVGRD